MLRSRQIKTLQKFSSVHTAFHNLFNRDRHLNNGDIQSPTLSRAG